MEAAASAGSPLRVCNIVCQCLRFGVGTRCVCVCVCGGGADGCCAFGYSYSDCDQGTHTPTAAEAEESTACRGCHLTQRTGPSCRDTCSSSDRAIGRVALGMTGGGCITANLTLARCAAFCNGQITSRCGVGCEAIANFKINEYPNTVAVWPYHTYL